MKSFALALVLVIGAAALVPVAVRTPAEVDGALEGAWNRAQLTPAGPAPAHAWLRRVWLDLTGTIPPAAAVRAFAQDSGPAARARVVAELLSGPGWAKHWGRILGRALIAPRADPDANLARTLAQAVEAKLAAGATWPAIVRGLVLGNEAGGLGAFRGQFAEAPHEVAGQLGSAVFGMRLRCAQCHDDPLHGWKVGDYYGLAAFFGTPRRANVPLKLFEAWKNNRLKMFFDVVVNLPEMRPRGMDNRWVIPQVQGYVDELRQFKRMGLGDGHIPEAEPPIWTPYDVFRIHAQRRAMMGGGNFDQRVAMLFDRDGSELAMPELPPSPVATAGAPAKGQTVTPRWPNEPGRPAPAANRRAALAAWAGDPANPLVARALVNRVWAELMGRGLVEPVDEVARPVDATHRELLDRLAAGFAEHNGNVKWLLTTIVSTRAYGMDCGAGAMASRPLTRAHHGTEIEVGAAADASRDPERMFAVRRARPLSAAEVEAVLARATGREASGELSRAVAKAFDQQVASPVVDEAGARQGELQRGLFLLTGPELQRLVEQAPLLEVIARQPSSAAALEELFLSTLARLPESGERERLAPHLTRLPVSAVEKRPWADTLWALLSSAENLTNH